jgi:hypothetical protein
LKTFGNATRKEEVENFKKKFTKEFWYRANKILDEKSNKFYRTEQGKHEKHHSCRLTRQD